MKKQFLAGIALLCAGAAACASDLTVRINGSQEAVGRIMVVLYANAESFPAAGGALRVAMSDSGTGANVTFRDLDPGKYAVVAFQDQNGNGQLDRNIAGVPVEPYGFSRGALPVAGRPSFDAAAVEVPSAGTAILVQLR